MERKCYTQLGVKGVLGLNSEAEWPIADWGIGLDGGVTNSPTSSSEESPEGTLWSLVTSALYSGRLRMPLIESLVRPNKLERWRFSLPGRPTYSTSAVAKANLSLSVHLLASVLGRALSTVGAVDVGCPLMASASFSMLYSSTWLCLLCWFRH